MSVFGCWGPACKGSGSGIQTVVRYLALATDYDSTLARQGRVSDSTLAALERFIASGRRVILVTGRELDDLRFAIRSMDITALAKSSIRPYCTSRSSSMCWCGGRSG